MKRIITVAIVIFVLGGAFYYNNNLKPVTRSAKGLGEPVQTRATGTKQIQLDDWKISIEYQAKYKIDALVVHTKKYGGSSLNDTLSPKDLALAWGDVAAQNGEMDFNWSQSGRWYRWYVASDEEIEKVGGENYVNTHSANCHIIPADDTVRQQLKAVKQGDIITVEGYLVNISGACTDGRTYHWNSSLSRSDTGDGACEVIYATGITER